jgi:serine/threonine protein kinase
MELTVQNVYSLLERSRLLPADEAQAMFARWREAAQDAADDPAKFAGWMVSNGYVTEYQAALLARGYADGFFLNDYKILDRLGKGRMAGVYKGVHRTGQVVAIKVLPPSKAKEPNLLGRFKREARLARRLRHTNIVRTFQLGTAEGVHYLVMEYLEGETLEEVMARRGPLPPAEAVRLAHQALQGLQHVHERGLIHRDLKPANLMLVGVNGSATTLASTVKLLDIGLGRVLFEEGVERASDPGLTSEGVLLGTPDYMSPEQARDPRSANIRSDVYSLGCVLYHMLSGRPPFPDTNIISQMIRHASEPAQPLKDFNPAVPDGLQQIVNWMMAKEPGARYPTPERAAQALQVFLAAGAESADTTASDASMNSYLSWLEGEDRKEKPSRRPEAKSPRNQPATEPSPMPDPATPKRKKAAKEKGGGSPSGPDTANVAASSVEPVPARSGRLDLSISRRELIAFSLGVGAGAVATFLGCLLALWRRERTPLRDDGDTARGTEP